MKGKHNRKPDHMHEMAGTLRPDRHGNPEEKPELEDGVPECPATLGDEAKREWFRVCADLKGAGLLKKGYRAVLIGYCQLYGDLVTAPAAFSTAQHTQIRQYIQALGLSPQAISGLSGTRSGGKASDFEALDD